MGLTSLKGHQISNDRAIRTGSCYSLAHMANYGYILDCPSCGMHDLNLLNYSALMVIRNGLGLFTLTCPNCSNKISSIQPIPPELSEEVEQVAREIGAGMGND